MKISRRLLGAVTILLVLGVIAVALKQRKSTVDNASAIQPLKKMQNGSVEALKEAVTNGQSPEKVTERIHDYTAKIGEAAATMSPNERKPLFAAQRVFAQMAPHMGAYESALKELNDAGVASPATLKSTEALAERIAMAKRFQKANQVLLEFYRDIENKYRVELDKEKLPTATKTAVMAGFKRGANVDVNLTIRECDEQIAATLLKILELLNRHWGRWKVQAEDELSFDQGAALSEYRALQDDLRAITERQQTAQKELLRRAEQQQPKQAKKTK